jgi:Sulfotransferase family
MSIRAVPDYTVDSLVDDARTLTGAPEDEPFEHLAALAELSAALDSEADLTSEGRVAVRQSLVSSLAIQVDMRRRLASDPHVARQPIVRPVFIIGLLRTGTTLVHNLLAQHPGLRCPNLWELMTPGGPNDPLSNAAAARAAQAYVDDYYRHAPELPKIHFLDSCRPDECHRLTANSFRSMVFWMRFHVPGYARWLDAQDQRPAYRSHRSQLQAILWRMPGGVPVLKCPFHLWYLDALLDTYPDARFVHLHRSPTVSVPSTCSLSAVIRGARSDRVDRMEIGRFWLAQVERGLSRVMAARDGCLSSRPVLDIRYPDLVADPLAAVARICEFLEVPLTNQAANRMRRYLAENPAGRHGEHRYTAEEFGLRAADLDERFADYRKRHDL